MSGNTKSCGCILREYRESGGIVKTHGMSRGDSRHPMYNTQIRTIRDTPRIKGTIRRLATEFGVSESLISGIVNGKRRTVLATS